MTMSFDDYRAGLKVGARSEFMIIGDVIPGHEEALREAVVGPMRNPNIQAVIEEIGTLHEARFVLLDGDTRLMFASSFDGSWDTYIDDFARTQIGKALDDTWQHVQGFPGITSPDVKRWFKEHTVVASSFVLAYPDPTVKEVWRALAVNRTFQEVLDDPAAAEALQHPALKPLLDEAAA